LHFIICPLKIIYIITYTHEGAKILNNYIIGDYKQQKEIYKDFLKNIVDKFIKKNYKKPFIIGLTGSVASGKTTLSYIFQEILKNMLPGKNICRVSTDNFLKSNEELIRENILNRKGFPESYKNELFCQFFMLIKSGIKFISIPVYSHLYYDIIQENYIIRDPDIIILEGLGFGNNFNKCHVYEHVDVLIFIKARMNYVRSWYISRFYNLIYESNNDPKSFYYKFRSMNDDEIMKIINYAWYKINLPNYYKNIVRLQKKSNFIIVKTANHVVLNIIDNNQ